jgi:ammonia channel protein AmtB
MDFAGGTAVHITSGTTILAYLTWLNFERYRGFLGLWGRLKYVLKKTGHYPTVLQSDAPHNIVNIVLGTTLLWLGWFGFNGGSALGGNMRAVNACVASHVAATTGGCVAVATIWLRNWRRKRGKERPFLVVTHFCDGVIIGLVAITPGAGYVSQTQIATQLMA